MEFNVLSLFHDPLNWSALLLIDLCAWIYNNLQSKKKQWTISVSLYFSNSWFHKWNCLNKWCFPHFILLCDLGNLAFLFQSQHHKLPSWWPTDSSDSRSWKHVNSLYFNMIIGQCATSYKHACQWNCQLSNKSHSIKVHHN